METAKSFMVFRQNLAVYSYFPATRPGLNFEWWLSGQIVIISVMFSDQTLQFIEFFSGKNQQTLNDNYMDGYSTFLCFHNRCNSGFQKNCSLYCIIQNGVTLVNENFPCSKQFLYFNNLIQLYDKNCRILDSYIYYDNSPV